MKFQIIRVCKTAALTWGLQHSVLQFFLEDTPKGLGSMINPLAVATHV